MSVPSNTPDAVGNAASFDPPVAAVDDEEDDEDGEVCCCRRLRASSLFRRILSWTSWLSWDLSLPPSLSLLMLRWVLCRVGVTD